MSYRPIFITARFRSGSTLLWNIFRHIPDCICYYEPCNDMLLTHIDYQSDALPTHRGVKSYWDEYLPILEGVHARHRLEFGTSRLFLERQDEHPELERYLHFLIESSGSKCPVLQFNRVDFRLDWLRQRFPSALILHLLRNSRDSWYSMVRSLPEGAWKEPLTNTSYDLALWSLALSSAFPFLFLPVVTTTYHRHYLLWRLSGLLGERTSDLTLDFDRDVLGDTRNTAQRLADLASQQGADIEGIAGLVIIPERGRWRELADEKWFEEAEAQCDGLLDSLGLLEHFGRLPLAAIRQINSPAWGRAREEAAEALAYAASRISGEFRENWLKLRFVNKGCVESTAVVIESLKQEKITMLDQVDQLKKVLKNQSTKAEIARLALEKMQILLVECEKIMNEAKRMLEQ